ncbi:hypothetical protein Q4F19_19165 [Sphingomonas sp. BIUV-7]|uniref:LPP20 lipoprotein n=1 Tax=Sphingomonas natans TaxID=3063330 RepID=A0ABT8YDT5_9SPHN|nr:hypothetical protein [Sphingomonas sp. BIUV-7]MDO6416512.1 hypothetical protein [Sphingomonas sp. BIUV-7]
MRFSPLFAFGGLMLAGCSATLPDVPSLGSRPVEHQAILPPDAASEPQTAASPALTSQLTQLLSDAKAGHAAFETERKTVSATISRAKGAAEGSEAWIAGQEALSALEAARTPVRNAAGAIDGLRVDPAFVGTGDREAIEAAAAAVAGLAAAEADAVDGLTG